MNVAELIASIEQQLDSGATQVSFSRDNAMSVLTRLTLLKSLIDKGEDKTASQIAALQTQRAEAAERKAKVYLNALIAIRNIAGPHHQEKAPPE